MRTVRWDSFGLVGTVQDMLGQLVRVGKDRLGLGRTSLDWLGWTRTL